MAVNKLNPKQLGFVTSYLTSFCAKAAYMEAYGVTNPRTAESNGHRLLRNAEVKTAIQVAQEQVYQEGLINKNRVIHEIAQMAFSPERDALKLKSLELLAKHFQLFEKNVEPEKPDKESMKARLKCLLDKIQKQENNASF